MKKQLTQTCEYVFSREEIKTIKTCLDYCHHRLYNHQCGISGMISMDKLSTIRKELENL